MQIKREFNAIKDYCCIGCGTCTLNSSNTVFIDSCGKYNVKYTDQSEANIHRSLMLCPFSTLSDNENVIGKRLFLGSNYKRQDHIGYYLNNYIAHVNDENIRSNASSGGITTWLLTALLEKGLITHAVHVGNSTNGKTLFKYTVSTTAKSVFEGGSSKYYPVEMSSVLEYIRDHEGSYAVVALPCFVKSLRLLQKENILFRKRIKLIISPICGHLKTLNYANFLAWQKGIDPKSLLAVNFRLKLPNKKASQYGTKFSYLSERSILNKEVANSSYKMGTDWGHGMFKYSACDYCDDVVGELADVSVGDAWLPEYIVDPKGNSIVIVRNELVDSMIKAAFDKNELYVKSILPDQVIESQAGGIRNKHEDLQYRLWLKKQKGEWRPIKRVEPSENSVSSKRKRIIELRIKISKLSHKYYREAIDRGRINFFYKRMIPILNRYTVINKGFIFLVKLKIKQIL